MLCALPPQIDMPLMTRESGTRRGAVWRHTLKAKILHNLAGFFLGLCAGMSKKLTSTSGLLEN